MKKINIILADDHKMFAEGVRFILGQEPDMNLLGEAGDGEETLELLQRNPHTDLLLLDLEMPKQLDFRHLCHLAGEIQSVLLSGRRLEPSVDQYGQRKAVLMLMR